MSTPQKEPRCVIARASTPRNALLMGHIECTLNVSCDPELPRRYLEEWLQWMDTIYEQVDAEIASMREFHQAWARDRRVFRRMVRAACRRKYDDLNVTVEGSVWPLLSRLNVHRPFTEAGQGFRAIEDRIIQTWSKTYV